MINTGTEELLAEINDGIGLITKPGLPIAVGEPAINPVPRQMMRDAVATLAAASGAPIIQPRKPPISLCWLPEFNCGDCMT